MSNIKKTQDFYNEVLYCIVLCSVVYTNEKITDLEIVEANSKFATLTGIIPSIGLRASNVIPTLFLHESELIKKIDRVIKSGKSEKFEQYIESSDLWVRINLFKNNDHSFYAALENISELKQIENDNYLLESNLRKAQIFANMGSWQWDIKHDKVKWSEGMFEIFGVEKENWVSDIPSIINKYIYKDDREKVVKILSNIKKTKNTEIVEYRIIRQSDKVIRTVLTEGKELILDSDNQPKMLSGYVIDITEKKNAEFEKNTTIQFLQIINKSTGIEVLLKDITQFIHLTTGCEAVGIRLKKGEDYPYYETRGFDNDFIKAENTLCRLDENGDLIRDKDYNPVLECMCGNILCRRFDSKKDFFSDFGSFYSNSTTKLLATTTDADRQARTRNRCNGEGYESVALIPLLSDKKVLGLLQINDRHENMFNPELIQMWERLAGYLSIAIRKLQVEEQLSQKLKDREVLLSEIHHRVKNNLQIIISLLALQKENSSNDELHDLLNISCSRIFSMSLVHDCLYNSKDFEHISLTQYINSLVSYIDGETLDLNQKIDYHIDTCDEHLSIEIMVPLGLIINELIANSIQHAFIQIKKPEIVIQIKRISDDGLKFIYRDNGCGIPNNDRLELKKSIGLSLIRNLTEQIGIIESSTMSIGYEYSFKIAVNQMSRSNYRSDKY